MKHQFLKYVSNFRENLKNNKEPFRVSLQKELHKLFGLIPKFPETSPNLLLKKLFMINIVWQGQPDDGLNK